MWRASVTVHALMHLVPLHSPRHLTQLQTALNQSLGYTFRISVTAVPYLCIDLGFPPLNLQAAVALVRLHCRLHHLPPPTLSVRLFRLRTSYSRGPMVWQRSCITSEGGGKRVLRILFKSYNAPGPLGTAKARI